MPVKIHSVNYYTVVERVDFLHKEYPNRCSIRTSKIEDNDSYVEVMATITIQPEPDSKLKETVFDGLAREYYVTNPNKSRQVNFASALENAETSSIGRALAAAGLSGGGEYATANEMEELTQQKAIKQQQLSDQKAESELAKERLKETIKKYLPPELEEALLHTRGDEKLSPKLQESLLTYYRDVYPPNTPAPETIGQAVAMYKKNDWKPFSLNGLSWNKEQVDKFIEYAQSHV